MIRSPVAATLALGLSVLSGSMLGCSSAPSNSHTAVQALREGNQRFVEEDMKHPRQDRDRVEDTARAQHPYATVLACSDSRVPVELLFDQGVGDLFVVRVAGNVCDTDEIASIEYGVDHLETPLLVILGHEQCGAVTAVASGAELNGQIPALLDNIQPAFEKAKIRHPYSHGDELIAHTVRENIRQSMEDLFNGSATVRARVANRRLKVIGAVYDVATGHMEWLGEHPAQDNIVAAATEKAASASEPH